MKEDLIAISSHYGWEFFEYQEANSMARFIKNDTVVNVYCKTLTVSIVHNKKQGFLKKLTLEKIELIFMKPENYLYICAK